MKSFRNDTSCDKEELLTETASTFNFNVIIISVIIFLVLLAVLIVVIYRFYSLSKLKPKERIQRGSSQTSGIYDTVDDTVTIRTTVRAPLLPSKPPPSVSGERET